ncbi:hypothetical protein [Ruegeria atlantica]|uniref:hypothetical protein n=1 Tax=Ruegeria atlantica TaxID=81569 RepID=UPI00147E4E1C|nr:hypothetical protein [Ruegeria atlantica]
MISKTALTGAAGEHYVLSELLRRGYIATLAPQGAPNMDVVVADTDGRNFCAIQVKTRQNSGRDGGWHMSAKHEKIIEERLFYAFVDFGCSPTDSTEVYLVPSAKVAEVISAAHAAWLDNPGKGGRKRKDGPMRRFTPDYASAFGPKPNPYPTGWLEPYRRAWWQLENSEESH